MSSLQCPTQHELVKLQKRYQRINFLRYVAFMVLSISAGLQYFYDGVLFKHVEYTMIFCVFVVVSMYSFEYNPFRLLNDREVIEVSDVYLQIPEIWQYIKKVNDTGRPLYDMDITKFHNFKLEADWRAKQAQIEQAKKKFVPSIKRFR